MGGANLKVELELRGGGGGGGGREGLNLVILQWDEIHLKLQSCNKSNAPVPISGFQKLISKCKTVVVK